MKPKPLAALKNFTVPMVINFSFEPLEFRRRDMRKRLWKRRDLEGRVSFVRHAKARQKRKKRFV
jgi:hypothetical protein